jgi:hypothetical protein
MNEVQREMEKGRLEVQMINLEGESGEHAMKGLLFGASSAALGVFTAYNAIKGSNYPPELLVGTGAGSVACGWLSRIAFKASARVDEGISGLKKQLAVLQQVNN